MFVKLITKGQSSAVNSWLALISSVGGVAAASDFFEGFRDLRQKKCCLKNLWTLTFSWIDIFSLAVEVPRLFNYIALFFQNIFIFKISWTLTFSGATQVSWQSDWMFYYFFNAFDQRFAPDRLKGALRSAWFGIGSRTTGPEGNPCFRQLLIKKKQLCFNLKFYELEISWRNLNALTKMQSYDCKFHYFFKNTMQWHQETLELLNIWVVKSPLNSHLL